MRPANGGLLSSLAGLVAGSMEGNVTRIWIITVLVSASISVAGCSGSAASASAGSPSAPASLSPESSPSTAVSASPSQPAIVGEWVGVHDCERIVTMLTGAGLTEFVAEAVYGNGLVAADPHASGLKDQTHPCDGTVQRQHSHFFTASGEFGSKDFNGQRVDDGSYTLEGDDVVVINGKRFTYQINGDELSLEPEPVDVSGCTDRECRFGATWVLMVAMPGSTWTRGEL
ncbi:MAG TPA: hypothetical protein VGQ02_07540 [Candidatus Limnocylindrales bacterium]|nr:hypothetical protein [Candidatus Limnocylindrales bacterium]